MVRLKNAKELGFYAWAETVRCFIAGKEINLKAAGQTERWHAVEMSQETATKRKIPETAFRDDWLRRPPAVRAPHKSSELSYEFRERSRRPFSRPPIPDGFFGNWPIAGNALNFRLEELRHSLFLFCKRENVSGLSRFLRGIFKIPRKWKEIPLPPPRPPHGGGGQLIQWRQATASQIRSPRKLTAINYENLLLPLGPYLSSYLLQLALLLMLHALMLLGLLVLLLLLLGIPSSRGAWTRTISDRCSSSKSPTSLRFSPESGSMSYDQPGAATFDRLTRNHISDGSISSFVRCHAGIFANVITHSRGAVSASLPPPLVPALPLLCEQERRVFRQFRTERPHPPGARARTDNVRDARRKSIRGGHRERPGPISRFGQLSASPPSPRESHRRDSFLCGTETAARE